MEHSGTFHLKITEIKTMRATKKVSLKAGLVLAGALLTAFLLAPSASATPVSVRIVFSGPAGSGVADLTLDTADSRDVVYPDHPPMAITAANGYFNGTKINGVLGTVPNTAPGETLPYNYSLFHIKGVGDHDGVTYDNLFYPGGSPAICYVNGTLVFPFSGGFLDLMGVMFTLDNGDMVDLWSFGVVDPTKGALPPFVSGLTYGIKVIRPTADGFIILPGMPFGTARVVAEPGCLWIFGAALLGLFAWRRVAETRKVRRIG